MESDHLLEDIREVNLSYLLLMQRLINTDREAAMFRLKIDEEMADLLGRIPVPELAKLARCNQLLCHFSLQDADQLYSLIDAGSDDSMRQVHAAILLGSNERRAANDRRVADRRSQNLAPPHGVERRRSDRRESERRKPKSSGKAESGQGRSSRDAESRR